MEIMRMEDYSFRYAGAENQAVEGVSLGIEQGELILIAGDSGSGKSTFLKSLNGLIPAVVEGETAGVRYIDGKDMQDMPIFEISRSIGSVFQNPRSQFFTLNSTSELVFAMENYGFSREQMKIRLDELGREIPVDSLIDRNIMSLSSGERQLLALACAMMLSPRILLFDEPSANLDYGNVMRLRRIFSKLKQLGKTVLVADHRFFYLNGMVDRVFLLKDSLLTVYPSESEFRASDYNTRSFDLFGMSIPPKSALPECLEKSSAGSSGKYGNDGVKLAELINVEKRGIIRNISVSFNKNEVTSIIGVNGAGKTTLARLMTGSLKPDGGEVRTDKMPFYIMQDADYQLFGTSVLGELEIGGTAADDDKKREVLQRLGIWKYKDSHPFDLSGGEKQRLQIAMAALSDSSILIFDEPTSGLDIESMNRAVAEIAGLSAERAVIIISHDYEFIRKISDRIVYMEDGSVKEDFYLCEETVETLNNIFLRMEVKSESWTKA